MTKAAVIIHRPSSESGSVRERCNLEAAKPVARTPWKEKGARRKEFGNTRPRNNARSRRNVVPQHTAGAMIVFVQQGKKNMHGPELFASLSFYGTYCTVFVSS